jgi:oligosaccharide repeat unit polymerase
VVTLALFSEYFGYIFRTYGFSSIHVILFQLRTQQAQHGAPTFGFYFFYAAELLVPLSVVLALGDTRRRRRYVTVALVSTGALLTTSGRTNATIAIVWSLCVLAIFWGGRRFKFSRMAALALGVVSLLGLFLLLGTAIGKTYANSSVANEFGENPPVPALLVEPYFYVSSPLVDFSQVVAQSMTNEGGRNTFREVYQVIHAVEPQVTVPPLVEPFHYIPYPDNVSTSITPFYEDFGIIGILLGEFLIGVLLAWAYSTWLIRRSPAALTLAAMATLVAFTSTGPAQYNQPSWIIQALLLCFIIHTERQSRHRAEYIETRSEVAPIAS